MIAKKEAQESTDRPLRALGIDFGEKRIGLAISDADGRWAMPLATLERRTDRRAAHQIADLARREGVGLLVFGERHGLDGKAGDTAPRIRRFGQRVARITGLPIRWINEALTTVEATERLRAANLDRQGRQGRPGRQDPGRQDPGRQDPDRRDLRDAVAAQILLQEALDQEHA